MQVARPCVNEQSTGTAVTAEAFLLERDDRKEREGCQGHALPSAMTPVLTEGMAQVKVFSPPKRPRGARSDCGGGAEVVPPMLGPRGALQRSA